MAKRDYIDPYEYSVFDAEYGDIEFGFDGKRTISLFGGSFFVTYPNDMEFDDIVEDILGNYSKYEEEDLMASYEAWGYYD